MVHGDHDRSEDVAARSRRLTGRTCDWLPVRRRGKSGSPATVLTITRRLGQFERQLGIGSVTSWLARQWRIGGDAMAAPPNPIYRLRPHAANRSPLPGRPVSRRTFAERGGVAGAKRLFAPRHATGEKRLGSDPIVGGSESPLTYPAARCPHDCARSRGSEQPPTSLPARAESRFSVASNRSVAAATPSSLSTGNGAFDATSLTPQDHSCLSACSGSSRVARRAGTMHATAATTVSSATIEMSVNGSRGLV